LFLKLRQWDYIASNRQDINLANSKNTGLRIQKYYKKDYTILYPPIEISRFSKKVSIKTNEVIEKFLNRPPLLRSEVTKEAGDFSNYYIIISALTEFKKIEIAISSFNNLEDNNLIVI
jgi:glycosyltransferase involved in cell wall biosynthesis